MQKFLHAIMYAGFGAVLFALFFCAVALLPFLDLDPEQAAYLGAGVGAVVGLGFGAYRKFE